MKIVLQREPTYILHTRAYRNTSALIDGYTLSHGKVTFIARGIKSKAKRSVSFLQPFVSFQLSGSGSYLIHISDMSAEHAPIIEKGRALYCGLYLNELMYKLLHEQETSARLFHTYEDTLQALATDDDQEIVLRRFETILLEEIGYGLDYRHEAFSGYPIEEAQWYRLEPERGFMACIKQQDVLLGKDLLSIARGLYNQHTTLIAKWINRVKIQSVLGEKKIFARQLFLGVDV